MDEQGSFSEMKPLYMERLLSKGPDGRNGETKNKKEMDRATERNSGRTQCVNHGVQNTVEEA